MNRFRLIDEVSTYKIVFCNYTKYKPVQGLVQLSFHVGNTVKIRLAFSFNELLTRFRMTSLILLVFLRNLALPFKLLLGFSVCFYQGLI